MTAVLIILAILLAAAVGGILIYNRLTALRLACENSWSQIDVALKLRHDLVPRLAQVVAGYAGHERETLEGVARARTAAAEAAEPGGLPPDRRGAVEAELGTGVGRLIAVAEDYPQLRAAENFLELQRELAEVEEKISITRRVYNDTVETYNTRISIFPHLLVARAGGFRPMRFFDAPVEARVAPQVSVAADPAPRPAEGEATPPEAGR